MSEARHRVSSDGDKYTEITYIVTENGETWPSVARRLGHYSAIEMILWVERMRSLSRVAATS